MTDSKTEKNMGEFRVRFNGGVHETGYIMEGHKHNWPHLTNIVSGTWRCRQWKEIVDEAGKPLFHPDGKPLLFLVADVMKKAGSLLYIEANNYHEFELLEGPGETNCIYLHREPLTGVVVPEYNGWEANYR